MGEKLLILILWCGAKNKTKNVADRTFDFMVLSHDYQSALSSHKNIDWHFTDPRLTKLQPIDENVTFLSRAYLKKKCDIIFTRTKTTNTFFVNLMCEQIRKLLPYFDFGFGVLYNYIIFLSYLLQLITFSLT